MWKISIAILILSASMALSVQPRELLVIDHVNIVDGTGSPILRNGAIVIEGGRIRDIGRRGTIRGGPGITILNAEGKWAIPGLIDAHVHFDQSGDIYTRPDAVDLRNVRSYTDEITWTRSRIPGTLARYLASGVTGVVDMGGPFWTFDVRDAANTTTAPHIAVSGPLMATVGVPELESADPGVIQVNSPQEVWDLIGRIAERKPDLVKVLFVHRPSDDLDRQSGLVEAIITESHKRGIRAAVHATELRTAKAALSAGADILVHSVDDRRIDAEFINMLKAREAIYIPTLMVTEGYDEVLGRAVKLTDIEQKLGDPDVIGSWTQLPEGVRSPGLLLSRPVEFENLQLLYAADVRIAAGTDAGNIGTLHGPAIHREMELMAEAGMRPFDIVIAATKNAAAVMGKREVGTLERGKLADLVLLDADPVRDIKNARKIFKVMKNGVFLSPPDTGGVASRGGR
jgi:imidazolonepropionase-like amidohydrolase